MLLQYLFLIKTVTLSSEEIRKCALLLYLINLQIKSNEPIETCQYDNAISAEICEAF